MKTLLFSGNDSSGRAIEYAVDIENKWYFYRYYGFNGYGKSWSAWMSSEPCIISPCGKYCDWGFTRLSLIPNAKIRLPKQYEAPTF